MEPVAPRTEAAPAAQGEPLRLRGTLERVHFRNAETGFTAATLELASHRRARVTGVLPDIQPGEVIEVTGRWAIHPQHGEQFQVEQIILSAPTTVEGIERYLASLKGIGPAIARRLAAAFGAEALGVIEREPERMLALPGLGRAKMARVVAAWNGQRDVRDAMVFLASHGITPGYARRIVKQYGPETVEVVKANPYQVADEVVGIGFHLADRVAQALGIDARALRRTQAGLLYTLDGLVGEGHVFYPGQKLIARAAKVLEVGPEDLREPFGVLARGKALVLEPLPDTDGEVAAYPRALHAAEVQIARRLLQLVRVAAPASLGEPAASIARVEREQGIHFAPAQREAIHAALTRKVLVITGGPGTGKTLALRAIISELEREGLEIALAAPTGRAAKRMSEATGRPASTIHRLLQWSAQERRFLRDQERPLTAAMVVVDEASMLDTALASSLLRSLPLDANLLLVGDVDQLPSVGPGNVFRDIIESGVVPVVRLSEIFRQGAGSDIVVAAHQVNRGELPTLRPIVGARPEGDCFLVERETPEDVARAIVELVGTVIPTRFGFDPRRDVQVLAPVHKGPIGTQALNQALQGLLNPAGAPLQSGARPFRRGDRVLQTRNNYDKDVFNGDIGTIAAAGASDDQVTVLFDERPVVYETADLDELVPAYAVSVHKAQGSEYPVVVVPVHTAHYVMLRRKLLYTALTRAKELAILVGTRKALGIAVRNARDDGRYSGLTRRLRAADSPAFRP